MGPTHNNFYKEDISQAGVGLTGTENQSSSIYQIRNTQIQTICNKYQLYSTENQTNYYQEIKNSYEAPIQVNLNTFEYKCLF